MTEATLSPEALAEWTPARRQEFAARFPASWERIRAMLAATPQPATDMTTAERIIALCAVSEGVAVGELIGPRRYKPVANARMAAAFLIYERCNHFSYPMIGRKLGGRDHTTILHSVRAVKEDLANGGNRFGPIVAYVLRHLNRPVTAKSRNP